MTVQEKPLKFDFASIAKLHTDPKARARIKRALHFENLMQEDIREELRQAGSRVRDMQYKLGCFRDSSYNEAAVAAAAKELGIWK